MARSHMNPQNDDARWHLDKRVPIALIATAIVQLVAAVWFVAGIKQDVEILKVAGQVQRERDALQDTTSLTAVNGVRTDIRDLGNKIDRLIERGVK